MTYKKTRNSHCNVFNHNNTLLSLGHRILHLALAPAKIQRFFTFGHIWFGRIWTLVMRPDLLKCSKHSSAYFSADTVTVFKTELTDSAVQRHLKLKCRLYRQPDRLLNVMITDYRVYTAVLCLCQDIYVVPIKSDTSQSLAGFQNAFLAKSGPDRIFKESNQCNANYHT